MNGSVVSHSWGDDGISGGFTHAQSSPSSAHPPCNRLFLLARSHSIQFHPPPTSHGLKLYITTCIFFPQNGSIVFSFCGLNGSPLPLFVYLSRTAALLPLCTLIAVPSTLCAKGFAGIAGKALVFTLISFFDEQLIFLISYRRRIRRLIAFLARDSLPPPVRNHSCLRVSTGGAHFVQGPSKLKLCYPSGCCPSCLVEIRKLFECRQTRIVANCFRSRLTRSTCVPKFDGQDKDCVCACAANFGETSF